MQVGANLVYACGNAGNNGSTRLTFGVLIGRQVVGTTTLDISLGGTNVTRISLTQTTVNSGLANLTASGGAVVSPVLIPSGTYHDQIPGFYNPITIDIPCTNLGNYSNTILAVTHAPCNAVYQVNNFAINSCRLETCGGQNFTCPGLKATLTCTPGYDCMWISIETSKSRSISEI